MNFLRIINSSTAFICGTIPKLVVILVVLSTAAGCSLFKKNEQPQLDLAKVELKEEVIVFTHSTIPSVYSGLVKLNREITLIDKELERLTEIEAEFPNQKRIIATEQRNWKTVKRELLFSLSKLKKEIETIYVTHLVNKEKGGNLIKQKKESMANIIQTALDASSSHTNRLKIDRPKSFVAKFKKKLFG